MKDRVKRKITRWVVGLVVTFLVTKIVNFILGEEA